MAILKLKPSGKDYIWGGHKLVDNYGKEMTGDRLAETWELSCHPDGPSFVANGEDAGKTLRQYIEEHGKKVLGTNCERFEDFPILTKFIDAQDNLSIQVHPDNEYALKNEATGHFHCRRKADDKLFQFYAGTGKIQGHDNARGIHALIKILLQEVRDED